MDTNTLAQFEEDKAIMVEKVKSALDQLQANLNGLNRNLETMNAIGSQFEAPSHLWDSFHKTIAATSSPSNPQQRDSFRKELSPISDTSDIQSMGEEERL